MRKIGMIVLLFCLASEGARLPDVQVYTRPQPDGWVDTIVIRRNGRISTEKTRQVGREGTAVPYPTVCRYLECGVITENSNGTVSYQVSTTVTALPSDENCQEFARLQSDLAANYLSYSERLFEFEETESADVVESHDRACRGGIVQSANQSESLRL